MKKYTKNVMDFTKLGIVQGVGADVVTKVGGNASSIQTMSSYNPLMANIVGGGTVLNMTRNIGTKRRRK